jgi:hypothetical protein
MKLLATAGACRMPLRARGTVIVIESSQERQRAHELLDMLPSDKVNAVCGLLEVMIEPLSRSLALAPTEEEDLTAETVAEIERARASIAAGKAIPHDEVLREFGLAK